MLVPSIAVVRIPRAAADPQKEETSRARFAVSPIECGNGRRVDLRAGAVLAVSPALCGAAGCGDCGPKVRQAAVLAVGTVHATHYGHVRVTAPTVLRPEDVAPWRGDVARFMESVCRTDRGEPLVLAAAVVLEVEPSGTGGTLDDCVCSALTLTQYGRAYARWGPCAVCDGTRRSPLGHVHGHAVFAHDAPLWYGHGAAPPEFLALYPKARATRSGLLGRMESAGLGCGKYQPIRGGVAGAAAYLRKIASYDGKGAKEGKRTAKERGWWCLWQAWYLGPIRRVSTHGLAYGRKVGWTSCGGDDQRFIEGGKPVGKPTLMQAHPDASKRKEIDDGVPEVTPRDALPLLRVYGFSEKAASEAHNARSLPGFVGTAGVFVETPAVATATTVGPMVPSVGQVPPHGGRGASTKVRRGAQAKRGSERSEREGSEATASEARTGESPGVPGVSPVSSDPASGAKRPSVLPEAASQEGDALLRARTLVPFAGAMLTRIASKEGPAWVRAGIGDRAVWFREGETVESALTRVVTLREQNVHARVATWYASEVSSLESLVYAHTRLDGARDFFREEAEGVECYRAGTVGRLTRKAP